MTIKEHLYLAAEIIGGKAWGIDKGVYPRIYMPSKRDMKVYFEFTCAAYEEATDPVGISTLDGPTLRVHIDNCGQHPNWYAGKKKKAHQSHWQEASALTAITLCHEEQLARDIMDLEPDAIDIENIDEVSKHLVNFEFDELRQLLLSEKIIRDKELG